MDCLECLQTTMMWTINTCISNSDETASQRPIFPAPLPTLRLLLSTSPITDRQVPRCCAVRHSSKSIIPRHTGGCTEHIFVHPSVCLSVAHCQVFFTSQFRQTRKYCKSVAQLRWYKNDKQFLKHGQPENAVPLPD